MTCKTFRKYLYAFADGELETRENLEALEHLNMCPSCCRKVAVQQALRASLARVYEADVAPPALHDRVHAGVGRTRDTAIARRTLRVLVPLAAAAAVGFLLLRTFGPESAPIPAPAVAFAEQIVNRHQACQQHGAGHHDETLPLSLAAGAALEERLGLPVFAPDLTWAGYTFHSADKCGVSQHLGSHLFYARKDDSAPVLSVFSLRGVPDLAGARVETHNGRQYHLLRSGPFDLVAWNTEKACHVICTETATAPKNLVSLAEEVQTVWDSANRGVILAALDRRWSW